MVKQQMSYNKVYSSLAMQINGWRTKKGKTKKKKNTVKRKGRKIHRFMVREYRTTVRALEITRSYFYVRPRILQMIPWESETKWSLKQSYKKCYIQLSNFISSFYLNPRHLILYYKNPKSWDFSHYNSPHALKLHIQIKPPSAHSSHQNFLDLNPMALSCDFPNESLKDNMLVIWRTTLYRKYFFLNLL